MASAAMPAETPTLPGTTGAYWTGDGSALCMHSRLFLPVAGSQEPLVGMAPIVCLSCSVTSAHPFIHLRCLLAVTFVSGCLKSWYCELPAAPLCSCQRNR
jgi:hypothetical protein